MPALSLGAFQRMRSLLASQSKNNVSITGGTITGVTFSGQIDGGIKTLGTNISVTSSTTLVDLTGLVYTVVPGTYKITYHCFGTSASSGGWKLAFNLSGTVITSWNMMPTVFTATTGGSSGPITTTTSGTLLTNSASAVTRAKAEGVAVIGTGGTMQLQFAQNTSNATASTVNAGSTIEFIRIA